MISISLLCEFITNPFGNEQKACELLSEIEGRELSDDEFERGKFCFQIAFYFLALLAVEANGAHPRVQSTFLWQLHERMRAFYARAVCVSDLVASSSERDQINTALCRHLDEPEIAETAAAPATSTKSALFDLVAVRRLCEYRDAMSRLNAGDRFYVLAQHVLLHYGAKEYHPIVVAIIADLLLANYKIGSEIVISGLEVISTREIGSESRFQPLPLGPGMPDLTNQRPRRMYSAGSYVLLLFEDAVPIGRKAGLRFRYVLALCDKKEWRPTCFVTLENSSSISNVLCVFERSGSHSNFGSLKGNDLLRQFMGRGIILLRDRFELGEIEGQPLPIDPSRHRWWSLRDRRTASTAAVPVESPAKLGLVINLETARARSVRVRHPGP